MFSNVIRMLSGYGNSEGGQQAEDTRANSRQQNIFTISRRVNSQRSTAES